MPIRQLDWSRLRPDLPRWLLQTVGGHLAGEPLIRRLPRPRRPRWLLAPAMSDQPWRLLVGACCVFLPTTLLALISPAVPVTTPGVVLLVAVAFSAYLADWVGGVAALILASLILDILFVGDRKSISLPADLVEGIGIGGTLVSGAALIWLIERIKRQSTEDRRAAVAARSAATALASLEAMAATQVSGDEASRRQLYDAVVRALVGINRAHAGAFFAVDSTSGQLVRVSAYGFGSSASNFDDHVALGEGFVGRVAFERRPVAVKDAKTDPRLAGFSVRGLGVRALLGAPVLGSSDQLLGVVVIGLLVPHRFTATDVARLTAFASQVGSIIETVNAIDAREVLLQRAREEQRRLELVLAAMPEAVVLAAPPDGRIVAANAAATSLFGSLDDALIIDRIRRADGTPCCAEDLPLTTALRQGEIAASVELLALRPAGEAVPVLASAAPVREPDGRIVAAVAVFRDIAALKEASRLKEEFVSVVSHELRSPLTPIRGFVQLVARDLSRAGGHEAQVRRLQSIADHVDRLTRLVDDLLDVSRLRAGTLEIRPMPTDLVTVCRDVLQIRAAAAPEHQLRLNVTEAAIVGHWDADRLHQLVDNLVGNAVKYSPAGGTVEVTLTVDPATGDAVMTVSDDGPGIPVEDRERVFSAFFRTREAVTSQMGGLGLGLYICRELVVAHGGRIEVTDAPNGGAAFVVRLPLRVASVAA